MMKHQTPNVTLTVVTGETNRWCGLQKRSQAWNPWHVVLHRPGPLNLPNSRTSMPAN